MSLIKTQLFCIPYAGASATMYMPWTNLVEDHIHIRPVELAGRGSRFDEPPSLNFSDALDDVLQQIIPLADKGPYAIFGHSMGAVLAFEVYYQLLNKKYPKPSHLFLSGRPAPREKSKKNGLHQMIRDKLNKFFILKGGIPKELAKHPDLAKSFRKVLQSDLGWMASYHFQPKPVKVDCPVTIFCGLGDRIRREDAAAWNNYVSSPCTITWIEGDHFFLNSYTQELVSSINQAIPKHSSNKENA
ncbi:thioesterase II family protein [Fictibacillus fluitans]|uniref:Alpha/beta fold hydrolase n=1 Tax=Fictibacillus fluitans TaxID=3058422 RepID=A0ABT8HUC7_9BACL|nr:alpha/beta fold hydrolase [Fictibacillus sp. NE201]MDN4524090.1 alpha/beta fold hydrolase [Fictibacillus sp. NE201]